MDDFDSDSERSGKVKSELTEEPLIFKICLKFRQNFPENPLIFFKILARIFTKIILRKISLLFY